ncbi:MAG: hypothetical protein HOP29_00650 [Phycisphaerales bacterium]|nr:hypothetical protein [Phycisphaerales bacterium]
MAVQFECPSCRNPIEIDDPWAGRTVACPYCRNAVTAPAQSTYTASDAPAPARAVQPSKPLAEGSLAAPGARRNPIAVWAFVISFTSVAFLVVGAILLEMRLLEEVGTHASPEDINKHILKFADPRNPDRWPVWFTSIMAMVFVGVLLWVAGLVCSVIGFREPRNRGFAVAGLCLSFALPLLILLSTLMAR